MAPIPIRETKVVPAGEGVSLVKIAIADAANPDLAVEQISLSVKVHHDRKFPYLVEIQFDALVRAVDVLREHTRELQPLIEKERHH